MTTINAWPVTDGLWVGVSGQEGDEDGDSNEKSKLDISSSTVYYLEGLTPKTVKLWKRRARWRSRSPCGWYIDCSNIPPVGQARLLGFLRARYACNNRPALEITTGRGHPELQSSHKTSCGLHSHIFRARDKNSSVRRRSGVQVIPPTIRLLFSVDNECLLRLSRCMIAGKATYRASHLSLRHLRANLC